MPPCKNSAASGFPAPVCHFIDVDKDGLASFSYAKQVGSLLGALGCIERSMTEAMSFRGRDREQALRRLAEEIRHYREKHDTICSQWDEALGHRIAAHAAEGG
jgi:hypothetical protein